MVCTLSEKWMILKNKITHILKIVKPHITVQYYPKNISAVKKGKAKKVQVTE